MSDKRTATFTIFGYPFKNLYNAHVRSHGTGIYWNRSGCVKRVKELGDHSDAAPLKATVLYQGYDIPLLRNKRKTIERFKKYLISQGFKMTK